MGYSETLKCRNCNHKLKYTVDGDVFLGDFKIYHYQCPNCFNYQEKSIEIKDNKVNKPSNVKCKKCKEETKIVTRKRLVCPKCKSTKFDVCGFSFFD